MNGTTTEEAKEKTKEWMREGITNSKIKQRLTDEGLDENEAHKIVLETDVEENKKRKTSQGPPPKKIGSIIGGLILLLLGVIYLISFSSLLISMGSIFLGLLLFTYGLDIY